MKYTLKYGTLTQNIDITQWSLERCVSNGILYIPATDVARDKIFIDPIFGVHKSIFIYDADVCIATYGEDKEIFININPEYIYTEPYPPSIYPINYDAKLKAIQSNLKLDFGYFTDEYSEQSMIVRFLTGNEHVLEIGGNIGRTSLIIASIIKPNCLLTLECDPNVAKKLKHNRDLNNLQFYIEASALSDTPLQLISCGTASYTVQCTECTPQINTISLDTLRATYNINFDTLILDCEGAFYYILKSMPNILHNIKLIIVENDYTELDHKIYVDNILLEHGFKCVYVERIQLDRVCKDRFYEVWSIPHTDVTCA